MFNYCKTLKQLGTFHGMFITYVKVSSIQHSQNDGKVLETHY